jgi:abelson tyrosine-protein kinase 1
VSQAAIAVLGTAGDVTHELLAVSVDVLHFAPVIGLAEAARVLLNIWDSLQLVDVSLSGPLD